MADELNFRITASDEASPVMDQVKADKEILATPVTIPIEAPGLVNADFTMKSMALQMKQLQTAGAAGVGMNVVTKEVTGATEAIDNMGKSSAAASLPLYRLAQIGAGTGVAFGGITDRALAAAASLAFMGSEFFPIVATAAAVVISMNLINDALGTTEKLAEDTAHLGATIGSSADSVGAFSKRVHDMAHDASS